MDTKRLEKTFVSVYILFLLFSFFYVKSALKEGSLKVEEKKHNGHSVEVKPVVVYLDIENGAYPKSYRVRLENMDTVTDLFEHLRNHEGFFYEVTMYAYGSEFLLINHQKAPESYRWRLYLDEKDITNEAGDIALEDEAHYTLKLEKEQPL